MMSASPPRLAIYGALHQLAAIHAAQQRDEPAAARLLDIAARVAAKVGETHHFRIAFGPTNVAIHRASAAVELGQTTDAVRLAERIDVDNTPSVERRLTHWLDLARAYTRNREDVAAVYMLSRIARESIEELAQSDAIRETLGELLSRENPAVRADLRPLADRAGLLDS